MANPIQEGGARRRRFKWLKCSPCVPIPPDDNKQISSPPLSSRSHTLFKTNEMCSTQMTIQAEKCKDRRKHEKSWFGWDRGPVSQVSKKKAWNDLAIQFPTNEQISRNLCHCHHCPHPIPISKQFASEMIKPDTIMHNYAKQDKKHGDDWLCLCP